MHSITPSAPSTAAADSLLLCLLPIFLQTAFIFPILTSPHRVSPISLHPNLASLLAPGPAGLTTSLFASLRPDIMGSRLGAMLFSEQTLPHGNAEVAVLLTHKGLMRRRQLRSL